MKANELRIGNYFTDYAGRVGQVVPETFTCIKSGGYKDSNYIPLTEEWLLKFGFENIRIGVFINKIGVYKAGLKFCYNASFFEYYNLVVIEHVHQLQNLYFYLTGEELTIKK